MPLSGSAFFAVILPVEKTNLYDNPSAERGTRGWTDVSVGDIGTASNTQQFGAYSIDITTDNAASESVAGGGTWTSGNGTAYTASAYVWSCLGSTVKMAVGTANNSTSGASIAGSVTIAGGGTWHRYNIPFTETANQNRRLLIWGSAYGQEHIYVDGIQVEVGSISTYFDGDQEGCYWTGIAHQSQSIRSGTYRGGGSVVALADLGLKPDDSLGVGMPPLETLSQSYALQAGAEFQFQRASERPFVLTCKPIIGTTQRDYHVTRRTIIDALKIDHVDPQQPVRLWYTGGQGTVQIDAVFASGLEMGERDGPMAEDVALRFIAHDPYWYATTDQGTALAPRQNIGSANHLVWRDPRGQWGTTGVNGTTIELNTGGQTLNDILINNGTIFVCGIFGTVGGTVGVRHTAMYRPSNNSWGSMNGGTTASVNGNRALAMSPAGSLFVGGDFTTAAGTRSPGVAQWNGAWGSLVGGSIDPPVTVRDLLYSPLGTLFVAGNFITVGNGTVSPLVAMWTGAAWGSLHPGTVHTQTANSAYALAYSRGVLTVAGDFTKVAGTQAVSVAQWGSGGWGSMGQGMLSPTATGGTLVAALAIGADKRIYAGGLFGSAGGGSAQNIAQWNGVQWFPLSTGLGTYAGGVYSLFPLPNGQLYIGGRNLIGPNSGYILPDDQAIWNNYAYTAMDINLGAGNSGTLHGAMDPAGTLFVAGGFSGTATAASVAQIVNFGRTDSRPVLEARNTGSGTVRIYQLLNTTTGDELHFDLALLPSEILTLDLGARTMQSSFRGNVFDSILPGSSIANWHLRSGTNYVSFFADSDNLTTRFYWRPRSWSADGGTVY